MALEWCGTGLDAPEQRLCMCDGWGAAVGRGERKLAPYRTDDPVASPARQQPERPPEGGSRDPVERLLLVGIAAGGAAEARVVERQGSADYWDAPRQLPFDRDGELPALRGTGLEQRVGARCSKRLTA